MKKTICIKTWQLAAAVVGLIVLFVFVKKCNDTLVTSKQLTIDSLAIANQLLEKIKNRQGEVIAVQTAYIVNTQAEIKELSAEKFDLKNKNERLVKKVLAFSSQVVDTKLDSIDIPYIDTFERTRFSDSIEKACSKVIQYMEARMITVPRTARDSTEEYVADLTATLSGIRINKISIPDSVYHRIIEKRGGFLRKVQIKKGDEVKEVLKFYVPKTIEFQTFHTNKKVEIKGQTSIFYVPHKRAKILEKLILIGGGLYIGTRL